MAEKIPDEGKDDRKLDTTAGLDHLTTLLTRVVDQLNKKRRSWQSDDFRITLQLESFTQGGYRSSRALESEYLINFLKGELSKPGYRDLLAELDEIGLSCSLLVNFYWSPLGFILYTTIRNCSETRGEDLQPLELTQKAIEAMWQSCLPYLHGGQFQYTIYNLILHDGPIYGPSDQGREAKYVYTDFQAINELAWKLRRPHHNPLGPGDETGWIHRLAGWVEIPWEVPSDQIWKSTKLNVPGPRAWELEEAFRLLDCPADVHALVVPDYPYLRGSHISLNGPYISVSGGGGTPGLPDWTRDRFGSLNPKGEFTISAEDHTFIDDYCKMRSNTVRKSREWVLIDKFVTTYKSNRRNEIIEQIIKALDSSFKPRGHSFMRSVGTKIRSIFPPGAKTDRVMEKIELIYKARNDIQHEGGIGDDYDVMESLRGFNLKGFGVWLLGCLILSALEFRSGGLTIDLEAASLVKPRAIRIFESMDFANLGVH